MNAPYDFNIPAYSGCYANPRVAMDRRHVFIVSEILRNWRFLNALEIGSFNGASSTAFVEAINGGTTIMRASFCDVEITPSLKSVIGNCQKPFACRTYGIPSWEMLASNESFDFVLIDANHDMESVSKELSHLVRRKPLCVMAHDTNATAAGYVRAEGAKFLADTFRGMEAYRCLEDCKMREGEETQRGLFFAAADKDLFDVGHAAFEKYCND